MRLNLLIYVSSDIYLASCQYIPRFKGFKARPELGKSNLRVPRLIDPHPVGSGVKHTICFRPVVSSSWLGILSVAASNPGEKMN